MSAYVVQDECINSIVTWLFNPRHEWEKVRVLEAITLTDSDHEAALGHAMFAMNCRAVDARYGDGQSKEFRDLDYTHEPLFLDSGYATYDKLGEFLYQCSEGDVPESALYKALDAVYNRMAHKFFRDMRERKDEQDSEVRRELRKRIEALEQRFAKRKGLSPA